jgi:hypothetical protein
MSLYVKRSMPPLLIEMFFTHTGSEAYVFFVATPRDLLIQRDNFKINIVVRLQEFDNYILHFESGSIWSCPSSRV